MSYTYDNAGRLISLTNPFGEATTYNYDGDGNMLTKTESGQTTTYVYNYEDKMVGVNLPGGTMINYAYDHEGKRISKTAGGATVAGKFQRLIRLSIVGREGVIVKEDSVDLSKNRNRINSL